MGRFAKHFLCLSQTKKKNTIKSMIITDVIQIDFISIAFCSSNVLCFQPAFSGAQLFKNY